MQVHDLDVPYDAVSTPLFASVKVAAPAADFYQELMKHYRAHNFTYPPPDHIAFSFTTV